MPQVSMPATNHLHWRAVLTGIGSLLALAIPGNAAHADPLDWPKLAQQPGALSAIAAAVDMLGECKAPMEFEQQLDDDQLSVTVLCPNTGDGAGAIIVEFENLGGNRFFAKAFKFAG